MVDRVVRILVVDDSVVYRKIIRDALAAIPGIEVIAIARDGQEALEKIESLRPDLITLDVEMPKLDGLGVLRELRRRGIATRAIMCSTLTSSGASLTISALHEGAFDFVVKPNGSSVEENSKLLSESLGNRVLAFKHSFERGHSSGSTHGRSSIVAGTSADSRSGVSSRVNSVSRTPNRSRKPVSVVTVGVSTGGPDALRQFLPRLPADFPVPILVVQHMPPFFTKSLADSLDALCALSVSEGQHGQAIEPGHIYIAPGGRQMKVHAMAGKVRLILTDDPPENSCRPAVDYLFRSVVHHYGSGTLGVIMTGMGSDGTIGCRQIKEAGGSVIAQNAESCVVFGMPRLPIEEGLADSIVPLDRLAEEVQTYVGPRTAVSC